MSRRQLPVLDRLQTLTHDELINLMVHLERSDGSLRRPGSGNLRKGKKGGLYQTSGREGRIAVDVLALHPADRATLYAFAERLADALAPRPRIKRAPETRQPLARGVVQTKLIPRMRLNPETGERERHWFGPYLYLRLWATGGDRERHTQRLKNIYVRGAGQLAVAFDNQAVTADEILDAYYAGQLDALVARYAQVDVHSE